MFKTLRKYIIFNILYDKGISKENLGVYDSALNFFYSALSLNPNSIKTYKAIARVCRQRKEYLNGIDFLNKASFRFPDNAELYALKGALYAEIKDYGSALKEYNSALKLNSSCPELYIERAQIKYLKGDIKGADEDYAASAGLRPDSDVYAKRAFCLLEQKKFNLAALNYKKALELNPSCLSFKFMLEELNTAV